MIRSQARLVGRRYAGLAWFHAGVQASGRLPNQAQPYLSYSIIGRFMSLTEPEWGVNMRVFASGSSPAYDARRRARHCRTSFHE